MLLVSQAGSYVSVPREASLPTTLSDLSHVIRFDCLQSYRRNDSSGELPKLWQGTYIPISPCEIQFREDMVKRCRLRHVFPNFVNFLTNLACWATNIVTVAIFRPTNLIGIRYIPCASFRFRHQMRFPFSATCTRE